MIAAIFKILIQNLFIKINMGVNFFPFVVKHVFDFTSMKGAIQKTLLIKNLSNVLLKE